jgi:putative membrane protein
VTVRLFRYFFPGDPRSAGTDPDYRFSLANERTFLSWIRTSLALVAGGLGAIVLLEDVAGAEVLGIVVLVLAFVTAATAYRRWAANELAMRLDQPLPPSRLPAVVTAFVALIGVIAVVLLLVDSR